MAAIRAAIRAGQRTSFRVVHYSAQRDHVHLLVEAPDADRLRSGIQGLATRMARAINRAFTRRRGRVWADRYHRRDLGTPREVRNALVYVLMNHRRHAVGAMRHAAERGEGHGSGVANTHELARATRCLDPCSSAVWFEGWSARAGPLLALLREEVPAPDERAVVEPRSWLLQTGWRRHGLLDPRECPRSS